MAGCESAQEAATRGPRIHALRAQIHKSLTAARDLEAADNSGGAAAVDAAGAAAGIGEGVRWAEIKDLMTPLRHAWGYAVAEVLYARGVHLLRSLRPGYA
eukprot:3334418-Prymnesium_polylepis.1